MSAAGLLLLSVLAVPPGEPVIDHNQPGQWGHQPVVRYFVRRPVDDARGHAWMIHCDVLDHLWAEYRAAGSTPQAWDIYKRKAAAAKRYYVYQDPYYVAQISQINVPLVHPLPAKVRRVDPGWRSSPTLPTPEAMEPPHLGMGVPGQAAGPGSHQHPFPADPRMLPPNPNGLIATPPGVLTPGAVLPPGAVVHPDPFGAGLAPVQPDSVPTEGAEPEPLPTAPQ
ncbi:MAG: hypothetical protein U0836_18390 [Pirellulales bacterium]